MAGKAALKKELQEQQGLPVRADVPLFAMISRLAAQKGFDAVLTCMEQVLTEMDVQFVIVGTGDKGLENGLKALAEKHENLAVNILFSNKLAHQVEAAADFFLMPSRYEPCGLNQLYSLRYGTIPVATRTGGLADTIIDVDENPGKGTGLLMEQANPFEIVRRVHRATEIFNTRQGHDSLAEIRKRAMSQDFSWYSSADEYIALYQKLIGKQEK